MLAGLPEPIVVGMPTLQSPLLVSKCIAQLGLLEVLSVFASRVALAAMVAAPPVLELPIVYELLPLLLVNRVVYCASLRRVLTRAA